MAGLIFAYPEILIGIGVGLVAASRGWRLTPIVLAGAALALALVVGDADLYQRLLGPRRVHPADEGGLDVRRDRQRGRMGVRRGDGRRAHVVARPYAQLRCPITRGGCPGAVPRMIPGTRQAQARDRRHGGTTRPDPVRGQAPLPPTVAAPAKTALFAGALQTQRDP